MLIKMSRTAMNKPMIAKQALRSMVQSSFRLSGLGDPEDAAATGQVRIIPNARIVLRSSVEKIITCSLLLLLEDLLMFMSRG